MEVLDLQRVENRGKIFCLELNVDDGTDDGLDYARRAYSLSRIRAC